jgi:hypothetical protein
VRLTKKLGKAAKGVEVRASTIAVRPTGAESSRSPMEDSPANMES